MGAYIEITLHLYNEVFRLNKGNRAEQAAGECVKLHLCKQTI